MMKYYYILKKWKKGIIDLMKRRRNWEWVQKLFNEILLLEEKVKEGHKAVDKYIVREKTIFNRVRIRKIN